MRNPTQKQLQQFNLVLRKKELHLYRSLLLHLCKDYDSLSYFRSARLLIERSDWHSLIELADSLVEQSYSTASEHFLANQFASLVRKFPFSQAESGFDPELAAIRKFGSAEHSCKRVNQRFRASRSVRRLRYSDELSRARAFVRYVLGDAPDLRSIYQGCGFSPGAAIGVHGDATNVSRKLLAERWTVTPGALHYAYAAVISHPQFREVLFPEHASFTSGSPSLDARAFIERISLVSTNKISFVPKTAKTHRSIAVEPLLNGYLQKGVDVYMRGRLARVGIDLSDQYRNQIFAREGSLASPRDLATIDLSSASDSISIELCREILPPDWFDFLNSIRSPQYMLGSDSFRYEKFVSMGNGFCFPLESLIFAALAHSVGAGRPGIDFLVYGDDIIVRTEVALPLIELMSYCGFKTNARKTFLKGPFRESCGADWFGGEDVRPFTLDFRLDSVSSLFKFLNLSRRNERSARFFFDGPWLRVFNSVPEPFRFIRPFAGNADTGIDSDGLLHLDSRLCTWSNKTLSWSWLELEASAVGDSHHQHHGAKGASALVYGMLSGVESAKPFTYRRRTITKVRRKSHCGATSTWLPPARLVT